MVYFFVSCQILCWTQYKKTQLSIEISYSLILNGFKTDIKKGNIKVHFLCNSILPVLFGLHTNSTNFSNVNGGFFGYPTTELQC